MEAADAAPGTQHDLLGHVLGLAAIAQQPQYRSAIFYHSAGQQVARNRITRRRAAIAIRRHRHPDHPCVCLLPSRGVHQRYLEKQGHTSCAVTIGERDRG